MNNPFSCCGQTWNNRHSYSYHKKKEHGLGRLHYCYSCKKHLPSAALKRYHDKKHTNNREFLCSVCHKSFLTDYHLRSHVKHCHNRLANSIVSTRTTRVKSQPNQADSTVDKVKDKKEKSSSGVQCADCGKCYVNKYTLRKHGLAQHVQRFCCRFCQSKDSLDDNPTVEFCRLCKLSVPSTLALKQHLESHENVYSVCKRCNKAMKFDRSQPASSEPLRKQPVRTSARNFLLRLNELVNELNSSQPVQTVTIRPVSNDLAEDEENCQEEKVFSFTLSDRFFAQYNLDAQAVRFIHPSTNDSGILSSLKTRQVWFSDYAWIRPVPSADNMLFCVACSALLFALANDLEKHSQSEQHKRCFAEFLRKARRVNRTRTPIKCRLSDGSWSCPKCAKRLSSRSTLKQHLLLHSGESFQCKICGKSLTSAAGLRNHVRFVHEKQRRYSCDQCNQRFVSKRDLSNHIRASHSTEADQRVYPCVDCAKRFKRASNLSQHRREVHGQFSRLVCHICHASFSRKSTLTKHLARHAAAEDKANVAERIEEPELFETVDVDSHIDFDSDDVMFVCSACQRVFADRDQCDAHSRFCSADSEDGAGVLGDSASESDDSSSSCQSVD